MCGELRLFLFWRAVVSVVSSIARPPQDLVSFLAEATAKSPDTYPFVDLKKRAAPSWLDLDMNPGSFSSLA